MNRRPPVSLLRKLLSYNPETGELTWKGQRKTGQRATWEAHDQRFPGRRHLKLSWAGKHRILAAHRVAWAMQTGHWPKLGVTHKDGDHANNRWDNLAEISKSRASACSLHPAGASGVRNVWVVTTPAGVRFMASVHKGGKHHRGSCRRTVEEATTDMKALREKLYGCGV